MSDQGQHQDMLLLQQATVERLVEIHYLVDACSDHTSLQENDVIELAVACGLPQEYLQAIKPKLKEEHAHAHR